MRAATRWLPFPGLAVAFVLSACAPVESFGEAAGESAANQVRDGREAAEDAARRIAGVARQLGEVARGLHAGPDDDTRADEGETPIVVAEETP